MNVRLIPCAACQRHVRVGDPECPFCGARLPLTSLPVRENLGPRRLKSVAVVTFHAVALGAALSGCSGETDDDASSDSDPRAGTAGAGGGAAGAGRAPGGGTIQPGTGGLPPDGGPTPIYRATPRG